MLAFVLRRTASGIVVIGVIATATFFLLHLGSGDVARTILGPQATQEVVALKNHELGLDRPILEQFFSWVAAAARGDLGRSWLNGELVTDAVRGRLSVTFTVVASATAASAVLAVALGALAALRGRGVDRLVQIFSVLAFAIPGFLVAIFLVDVFAIGLGWLPATGYVRPSDSMVGAFRSTFLPVTALTIGAVASVAQQVRGSMLEILGSEWVRTLSSRGLSTTRVVFRHVLRNAAGPALAILAVQFVGLLGGTVIIEQIFAIPGLGQLSVGAASSGDVPIVLGVVMVVAGIVIVVNLVIDILQGILNPKVRVA
jgi:peptide/nickel transport system permease protein